MFSGAMCVCVYITQQTALCFLTHTNTAVPHVGPGLERKRINEQKLWHLRGMKIRHNAHFLSIGAKCCWGQGGGWVTCLPTCLPPNDECGPVELTCTITLSLCGKHWDNTCPHETLLPFGDINTLLRYALCVLKTQIFLLLNVHWRFESKCLFRIKHVFYFKRRTLSQLPSHMVWDWMSCGLT